MTHTRPFIRPAVALLAAALLLTNTTRAATVDTADDRTLTGDLLSLDHGKLNLTVDKKPQSLDLTDVSRITLTPTVSVAAPPTTGPTTFVATLTLTNGDLLKAALTGWADQQLTVVTVLADKQPLHLPAALVSEFWIDDTAALAKAKDVSVEPGPEDVAYVKKEDAVLAVKGVALGIDAGKLKFRFDDQDREIALSKLVGLKLRGNHAAPLARFHERVTTATGIVVSGDLAAVDKSTLTLSTDFNPAVKVPMNLIRTVDFLNGRVSSLCDLTPAKVEQTPYFGHVIQYRVDQSSTGGPLVTSAGPVSRGIAVHSRCVLAYDLAGFDRFKTGLGFEDPAGRDGRVSARVLGDGKVLWQNPDARGSDKPADLDLPVTGVHELVLEIDFGQNQDVGDRVIWTTPRLIRSTVAK